MTDPHPTQTGDAQVKIEYESPEGHDYSEVHGDPNENLTVKTLAEKEGDLQPNLYGTTPDPHDPELTDFEQERRDSLTGDSSEDDEESTDASGGTSDGEQKQGSTPPNKGPGTPPDTKEGPPGSQPQQPQQQQ